jgi:hypothetical protein
VNLAHASLLRKPFERLFVYAAAGKDLETRAGSRHVLAQAAGAIRWTSAAAVRQDPVDLRHFSKSING